MHGKKIGKRDKRRHHRRHQIQHGMRDEVVQRSHIIAHELFHVDRLAITKPTKRQHRELRHESATDGHFKPAIKIVHTKKH